MTASGPAESNLRGRLVLVVDDEERIIRFVRLHFEMQGARVIEAHEGRAALEQVRRLLPDLVVLDVRMPGMDGFETLRALRRVSEVPVIMLTVQADEADRIRGLDLAADDYLAKPFSPGELVSRAQAVLRRAQTPADRRLVVVDEDLAIDFGQREVIARGQRVKLRPTEWRLLYHLVQNAGGALTRQYATGMGRIDICLKYGPDTLAFELKVWRDSRPDPQVDGLTLLDRYLAGLGLNTGWLVIFDQRKDLPPIEERTAAIVAPTPLRRVPSIR